MIKIIIADDHQIFIDGVKSVLKNVKTISIVGEALNGKQVLRLLDNLDVDIVLLDINMPILDGLETAAIIQKQYKNVKTIILSQFNDRGFIRRAIKYGVSGYLLKTCSKEELISALQNIHQGGNFFNIKNSFEEKLYIEKIILSTREKQVLNYLAKEYSSKEIADKMGIGFNSVRTYRERLMIKAGVRNTAGLIYWAVMNNLIE